jgi:hypothetical protein
MGIMSKVQHWLKVIFAFEHPGDLSKHRLHTTKYEDLCK